MNYILFDGSVRDALLPFTYTRPVADIRVGILTIREKWEKHIGLTTTTITEEYLEEKYPMVEMEANILINGSYFPSEELVTQIKKLRKNEAIFQGDDIIAFYTEDTQEHLCPFFSQKIGDCECLTCSLFSLAPAASNTRLNI